MKPIHSAGEAMAKEQPTVTRRRLLLGIAAASASAAALTMPNDTHAAAIEENPELVRLGDELPRIAEDYNSARAAKNAALLAWSSRLPRAPDAITAPGWSWSSDDSERSLDGTPLVRTGESYARRVWSAAALANEAKRGERVLRGTSFEKNKNGKHRRLTRDEYRQLVDGYYEKYAVARDYEAERDSIKAQSDIDSVQKRLDDAEKAFSEALKAILREPDRTMVGVVIKAQAIATASAAGRFFLLSTFDAETGDWGTRLANSVLTHAKAGA
jgi:hypothetical protein